MDKNGLRVPGALKHSAEARSEADLVKEMRTYVAAQPGLRFLADVLAALHAGPQPLRAPRNFYTAFPPRQVLQAYAERAELRARVGRAITGGAPTLLRRLTPADLAAQIELLVAEDLPASERALRAEEDRSLPVLDLYLKYLDPTDLAVYLPVATIWEYESYDAWWTRDATAPGRTLMAAELKSLRRHAILTDSELLDIIGDETLERDLPIAVRTALRAAARKAAREGKPFKDSDLFAARPADSTRDLTDDLAENIALPTLRKVLVRAAEVLGLGAPTTREEQTRPDLANVMRATTPTPASTLPPPARTGTVPKTGKNAAAAALAAVVTPAPTPTRRADATSHNRSKTQPVPVSPDGTPYSSDEEVVGPDHVVMIEEVPG